RLGWRVGLVGEELLEGRGAGTSDGRRLGGKAEALQGCSEDGGLGEEGDELAARVAAGTVEDLEAEGAFVILHLMQGLWCRALGGGA
ncbi:MAG: hypothetical protein AB1486_34595, partial [Planctomycetota bacterium]